MFRLKTFLITCLFMCMCVTGFTAERSIPDMFPDFFDILPWNVETGEYKDGRDSKITDQKDGEEHNKEVDKKATGESTETEKKDVKSIDLVVILDKSGSMYSLRSDTIGGFNSLLDEQRKKDLPVKVSLGVFNQILEAVYDRVDINEIKNMTPEDYMPQGTTALLDAVGNTLSAIQGREDVNAEGNKVLVVIITDGMENASKEWKKDDVKKLISDLQKDKGYEFVFLGADIDAVSVAQGIGIKAENSVKFKKSAAGVQSNFRAVSHMVDTVSAGESLAESAAWRKNIIEDKN